MGRGVHFMDRYPGVVVVALFSSPYIGMAHTFLNEKDAPARYHEHIAKG